MKDTIKIVFQTVLLAAVALTAAGCQMVIDDLFPNAERSKVKLFAGYSYSSPDHITRGTTSDDSGILNPSTITDSALEIGLVRIDQSKAAHDAEVALNYSGLTKLDCTLAAQPDASMLREISFSTSQFYSGTDYVNYLGWYPRGTFSSSATATTVVNTIDGKTDILYSTVAAGSEATDMQNMVFNHALCQFNLYVYKMFAVDPSTGQESTEGITNWGELTDIQLEQAFATCTYTLPETFSFSGSQTISTAQTDGIYFATGEIPTGFASKRLATRFLAAPPNQGLLDLFIKTTTVNAGKDISVANDFKAGYAYDVVLCFSDHGFINAEVSVGEWEKYGEVVTDVEADIYFNLSRYATANSYIVSSANTGYCFDGTVMGCGNADGGGTLVGVPNCTLTPGYIDILYSSPADIISLKSHQLNDGSVFFYVPGITLPNGKYDKTKLNLQQEGNVIIAAYDGIDGNIIWTWHIWITDRPKEQGYMNGYAVLDRNMGATYAPNTLSKVGGQTTAQKLETYGFNYQWGRKDPMIPTATSTAVGLDYKTLVPYSATTETATPAVAVAHPMSFYGMNADDWATTPSNHLWGYVSETDEYKKTIYDPCPPGYRVPERRTWDTLNSYKSNSNMGLFLVASVYCWYPWAGFIDSDSPTTFTLRDTADGGIFAFSCQPSSSTDVYHFEYNSTNTRAVAAANRADALPVRCISTTVQTVITNLSRLQSANSYVIPQAGQYKFKATVRGNGLVSMTLDNGNIAQVGGDMAQSITNIDRVDLLWWQGALNEGNNTAGTDCPIEILSTTPDAEGFVQFQIDESAYCHGNAIVAAFDSSNRILWTWHLWLTDEPEDVVTGDYKVMDRNLGATFAPTSATIATADRLATYGFYYQWGRKDPFPGPASYNTTTASTASSTWYYKNPATGTWSTKTTLNAVTASSTVSAMSVVAQNPTTFYTSSTRWYQFLDDESSTSLWGYGIANQGSQGSGLTKTVGDPCPPGYQVCHHHTWSSAGMDSSSGEGGWRYYYNSSDSYGQFFPTTNNQCYTISSSIFGDSFNNATDMNVDFCWYPFQGYRNGSNGQVGSVGSMATSYTALPWGAASTGNVRTYSIEEYNSTYAESGQSGGGRPAAYGRAVRCAKQ